MHFRFVTKSCNYLYGRSILDQCHSANGLSEPGFQTHVISRFKTPFDLKIQVFDYTAFINLLKLMFSFTLVLLEMAEPIQQLTRNNQPQDREMVPFAQTGQKKKCDQVLYEKRRYEKAKWACVNLDEGNYEQATCLGFMKLMRYICGQNSSGLYLGMTLPIVTIVRTNQSRSELLSTVTVAYHLPGQFQDQIPQPSVADIQIEEWPANIVYTRTEVKNMAGTKLRG
eukprot:gi/632971069/ref/XP_007901991.1/ PREDICTED: uncharacterized protein LOC103185352 isoform X2 [Callorhinchus milii]